MRSRGQSHHPECTREEAARRHQSLARISRIPTSSTDDALRRYATGDVQLPHERTRQTGRRHQNDQHPIDAVIKPITSNPKDLPLFFEAKSAGDFANTNKRRKEEAVKMSQLRSNYPGVRFNLFLCGYFDSGYLGYEAAEGIDWVWEHRIDYLSQFGI